MYRRYVGDNALAWMPHAAAHKSTKYADAYLKLQCLSAGGVIQFFSQIYRVQFPVFMYWLNKMLVQMEKIVIAPYSLFPDIAISVVFFLFFE